MFLSLLANALRRAHQVPCAALEYRGGLVKTVFKRPLAAETFFLVTVVKFH